MSKREDLPGPAGEPADDAPEEPSPKDVAGSSDPRQARLAAALRDNLKRRKAAARSGR